MLAAWLALQCAKHHCTRSESVAMARVCWVGVTHQGRDMLLRPAGASVRPWYQSALGNVAAVPRSLMPEGALPEWGLDCIFVLRTCGSVFCSGTMLPCRLCLCLRLLLKSRLHWHQITCIEVSKSFNTIARARARAPLQGWIPAQRSLFPTWSMGPGVTGLFGCPICNSVAILLSSRLSPAFLSPRRETLAPCVKSTTSLLSLFSPACNGQNAVTRQSAPSAELRGPRD